MPHISKRFLKKDDFLKIHKQLYRVVDGAIKSGNAMVIFDELLTKTEKIMLAKRLAIILMCNKNESPYAIEQVLKVSPSTAERISRSCELGEYKNLIKEVQSHDSLIRFIEKLIPPRVGRGRFKNFLNF